MPNATHEVRHAGHPPCAYRCRDHDEHLEAAALAAELARVLRRTGRYNLSALARRCEADGVRITRRQLVRWFHGQSAPYTTDPVELVARAAGVDRAYLQGASR